MFVHLSIHHPRKGREQELIDSMHRFGAAAQGARGFHEAHTLRDAASGTLVGLAVWVVPAPGRIRLWIAGLLVASTLLAWLLADPIRVLTGMPPSAPPDAPAGDVDTTGGA
mgnify:CR=1 FL=1